MSKNKLRGLTPKAIQAALADMFDMSDEDEDDEDAHNIVNNDYEITDINQALDCIEHVHLPSTNIDQPTVHSPPSVTEPPLEEPVPRSTSARPAHITDSATDPVPRIHNQVQENRPTYRSLQIPRIWSNNYVNHDYPVFNGTMTPAKNYNHRSQPIDYFKDLFPENLIDLITQQTNLYAIQNNSSDWTDTTPEEISAFIGMVIMMGISPQPDFELYWSSDSFFRNDEISKVMPLRRFKKILENLHVNDNTSAAQYGEPTFDRLHKVRPMMTLLNQSFQQGCIPSQKQCIDESMVKFKGRSVMKQYMPQKPIKRGYKVWARCESESGYLHQFDIYVGKDNTAQSPEEGLAFNVVTKLCANVSPNTLLTFDNFYTSVQLMQALYNKNIYCTGTVRSDRKGLPEEERNKRTRPKLKVGEFVFKYSDPMSYVRWMDTKDVQVLTTANDPKEVAEIERKQKDGSKKKMYCPMAIINYTKCMGGVDKFDHYRSSYSIGRKSKKTWMRLFWFMVEAAVINAYILYLCGHVNRKNTHMIFRLRLARSLVNNYTARKKKLVLFKNKKGGNHGVPDEIRLSGDKHYLKIIGTARRCRFCSTKSEEKRSRYECKICKVALCVTPCDENFHTPFSSMRN